MPAISALLILLSAVLVLLGCVCLALSQSKHATAVLGAHADRIRPGACQRWGWACLALSLACQILGSRGDFVIALWPMCFGTGALIVALALAFRPASLRLPARLPGLCETRPGA